MRFKNLRIVAQINHSLGDKLRKQYRPIAGRGGIFLNRIKQSSYKRVPQLKSIQHLFKAQRILNATNSFDLLTRKK